MLTASMELDAPVEEASLKVFARSANSSCCIRKLVLKGNTVKQDCRNIGARKTQAPLNSSSQPAENPAINLKQQSPIPRKQLLGRKIRNCSSNPVSFVR